MANIEYVWGTEIHGSTWGNFRVSGLEEWESEEDFPEARCLTEECYRGFTCIRVPENQYFYIQEESGRGGETENYYFAICKAGDGFFDSYESGYGDGKIFGNFQRIVEGKGEIKGKRLYKWWAERPEGKDAQWAQHCATYIEVRGIKLIPSLEG